MIHRNVHTKFIFCAISLHRCLIIELITYFYSIIEFEFHSCSNQIFSLFYLWMTAQVDEKKPRRKMIVAGETNEFSQMSHHLVVEHWFVPKHTS